METENSQKEREILEQYKMGQKESDSVTAWSKEYGIEEIMDDYLEKSGIPVGHPIHHTFALNTEESLKEEAILDQYIMQQPESDSVKAWSKEYGIEEIMNDYLKKSGYPTVPTKVV